MQVKNNAPPILNRARLCYDLTVFNFPLGTPQQHLNRQSLVVAKMKTKFRKAALI